MGIKLREMSVLKFSFICIYRRPNHLGVNDRASAEENKNDGGQDLIDAKQNAYDWSDRLNTEQPVSSTVSYVLRITRHKDT